MLHEPAPQSKGDDFASAPKAKLGVKLFWAYCLVYAGFVVINTLRPKTMEVVLFSGLNLAVVYGFGLIVFAIVLGLAYNHVCTRMEESERADQDQEGEE